MSLSDLERAVDQLEENEPDHPERMFRVRPEMHDALRKDAGLTETLDYCADCWSRIADGECVECGGTDLYDL